MLGYTYTTEAEAINARQLCATYKGLPNESGDTLYWVDYNHSEIDNIWFIIHTEGIEVVLGSPIEFTIKTIM